MRKNEIVKELAKRTGLSTTESSHALNGVIDIIAEALASGEQVVLHGFGALKPIRRGQKTGRDIRTGKALTIPPCVVVKFSAFNELKLRVNKEVYGG